MSQYVEYILYACACAMTNGKRTSILLWSITLIDIEMKVIFVDCQQLKLPSGHE